MTLRQDYESSASKLKTLERQVKTLRQEKDEVHKVVLLKRVVHRCRPGWKRVVGCFSLSLSVPVCADVLLPLSSSWQTPWSV